MSALAVMAVISHVILVWIASFIQILMPKMLDFLCGELLSLELSFQKCSNIIFSQIKIKIKFLIGFYLISYQGCFLLVSVEIESLVKVFNFDKNKHISLLLA